MFLSVGKFFGKSKIKIAAGIRITKRNWWYMLIFMSFYWLFLACWYAILLCAWLIYAMCYGFYYVCKWLIKWIAKKIEQNKK